MRLRLEKRFLKKLEKLNKKSQIRIIAKLKMLEEGGKVDLIKLEGFDNIYRLRIGDFRVKLYIEGDEIIAFDLERRERAYR
jgi:mRNA interferase RelE/StbE